MNKAKKEVTQTKQCPYCGGKSNLKQETDRSYECVKCMRRWLKMSLP